jgi:iron-sulfur cluster assembly protein/iron-sulfur cluster insertion protein
MINLTDSAVVQVGKMLAEKEEGMVLRIFIEPGGCSGFEYGMSVDFPKENDQVAECHNIRYAVAGDCLDYLRGSEVHFDDGLTGKGFEIRNPNAQSTCGCGKSFS